ncbi:probable G-protein coupled receptor 158 [Panonychus citri]|uniref:probable G-protein coupled receptor 158 n=1 Tax=Panonychus citri TaxID=50023 RepID=UPI0023080776|nr:probable G-protein coupled receptor 158 [Panonychus citri]
MDLSESSSSGPYASGTLSPDPQTIEYPSRILLHPSSPISSLPSHPLMSPCLSSDCSNCTSSADDSGESACFVRYNISLRSFTLGIHSFCATMTVVLAIVIFRLRRSKTIASSRWILLETTLLGAFLLYITVIIRYYEPTQITCFIEPWFREVGFGLCYGSITIKLYRIYAEFQTRKAHRVCVRDKDLLKYLIGIVMIVIGYMAAWSSLVIDSMNGLPSMSIGPRVGSLILQEGQTPDGLRYFICKELSWDYVTEAGEFSFLLTGVYITYCIRNAKPEVYGEKCSLCCSIYIEIIVSTITHILRHIAWGKIHPDYLLLLHAIRCQLTVTLILAILLGPKIWFHNRPLASYRNRSRYFSTAEGRDRVSKVMKLHAAILSNGEVDIGDINLADMDPEDIRSELRRVYTQLQILRNKTMRKDNPHISKRRGGRKGTHRRFSLQPFHHKHKHHEHEHETTEVSRTPEESTASAEAPSCNQPEGPFVIKIEPEAHTVS